MPENETPDRERQATAAGITLTEETRPLLDQETLTTWDAAKLAGVSPQAVDRAINDKRLKARNANVGRRKFRSIYWEDLLAWAQSRQENPYLLGRKRNADAGDGGK